MRTFADFNGGRVEFLDERYYKNEGGEYFPSVTTILDCYPKGEGFSSWLKSVGNNADKILQEAAARGSRIHEAIETLLLGKEVDWVDGYSLDEWKMIARFTDFYNEHKPEIIGVEVVIVSDTVGAGGTLDMVAMLDGERWLIDTKTGKGIYDSHYVQLATYAKMWNEKYPDEPIRRIGALHLSATTKGPDKTGKRIQGAGWKIEEPEESMAELYTLFKHTKALWHRINPHAKPLNLVMPASLTLQDRKVYVAEEQPGPGSDKRTRPATASLPFGEM